MKEIALAFVSAQKEFGVAHKSSNNPFFKSKYADLSTVIEAVMTALHNNDIALIQNCHESNTGVVVETIFIHKSGETISAGKLSVPAAKNDPQGYGSALTYARRYSLMAACGIAPEDDDGNLAVKAMDKKVEKLEPDMIDLKIMQNCRDVESLKKVFGVGYLKLKDYPIHQTILKAKYDELKGILESKS